jgi:hypothetical protein
MINIARKPTLTHSYLPAIKPEQENQSNCTKVSHDTLITAATRDVIKRISFQKIMDDVSAIPAPVDVQSSHRM